MSELHRYQFTICGTKQTWQATESTWHQLRAFYEAFGMEITDVVRSPAEGPGGNLTPRTKRQEDEKPDASEVDAAPAWAPKDLHDPTQDNFQIGEP